MILATGAAGMVIINPNGWCQFFAAKEMPGSEFQHIASARITGA